ncbi:MAG: lipoyl synthase [Planctomycetes bacterium]|nr:lipoyl synthase [Planctomycetota bacterium]
MSRTLKLPLLQPERDLSRERKPDWLRVRFPGGGEYPRLASLFTRLRLHTVCESAHCPNMGECWAHGTATFMILGNVCTRSCGFCAVPTGRPQGLDLGEPARVGEAVESLRLDYVVITSVNRDELPDGGASLFAATVREIRRRCSQTRVELLIPDFMGNAQALAEVIEAAPDVLNHNLETVPRLYPWMRPQAKFTRSLELLRRAKAMAPGLPSKSGFMVGAGEAMKELLDAMGQVADTGCDILTIGQYLRPTKEHHPVFKYYHPDEFDEIRRRGLAMGFRHVESGPLVRSSYHAWEQAKAMENSDPRIPCPGRPTV